LTPAKVFSRLRFMGAVMGYPASQRVLFSLLPKTRTPWREFVFSSGIQACVVVFLLWLRLLHPAVVSSPEHLFRSIQLISTPVPVNHQPQPVRLLSKPVYEANLDTPVLWPPSAQPPVAKTQDDPMLAVHFAAKLPAPMSINPTPVLPKVVAVNVFSTGSSAVPTTAREPVRVQTGGFGDPNGVPAKANPRKAVNIAALGSFDLPAGSGYGNGSGGTKDARGVVASSGFGSGTATSVGNVHPSSAKTVQPGGFGDADVAAPPVAHPHAEVTTPVLPAEIISKPTPIYTAEARSLRIQGEVLLEVVLSASGNLRVIRVVHGLGHGLDDNAVRAVEQIRFKPATRNGQPADSTVILHIVFQLA
jgi:TonB family protein